MGNSYSKKPTQVMQVQSGSWTGALQSSKYSTTLWLLSSSTTSQSPNELRRCDSMDRRRLESVEPRRRFESMEPRPRCDSMELRRDAGTVVESGLTKSHSSMESLRTVGSSDSEACMRGEVGAWLRSSWLRKGLSLLMNTMVAFG